MGKSIFNIIILTLALTGCREKPGESQEPNRITAEDIVPGPIVHDELSDLQISRITAVQRTFAEVDGTPLEKWLEDFQRDRNLDREIEIWEAMAKPYAAFTSQPGTTPEMKNEAFGLLLQRSGLSQEETLRRFKPTALSPQHVQELVEGYTLAPQPVTVKPAEP